MKGKYTHVKIIIQLFTLTNALLGIRALVLSMTIFSFYYRLIVVLNQVCITLYPVEIIITLLDEECDYHTLNGEGGGRYAVHV